MNRNLKDFLKEYCKNCKERCDKGIVEKADFIRCVDRNIFVKKTQEKIENN